MKTINKYIIGLLSIAVLSQSCKKELVDLNTNPKTLPDANPEFIFTAATKDFTINNRNNTTQKYGTTMTYMQYIVPDGQDANGLAGYYWNPTKSTGPNPGFPYYNDYFTGIGRDMTRIIAKIDSLPEAQKATYQSLKAVCQVLNVYQAWRTSDVFGALPYGQAFQPNKFPLPVYDFDFTLYKTFDTQLKDAALLLKNGTGQFALGSQDFFFNGDYAKWLSFANTLRIKIAQRYEKRDPAQLSSVLTDISNNFAGNIILSNEASFGYNQSRDWNNNVDDINVILFAYDAAFPFVEYLKSNNDPRIKFMVRENDFGINYKNYIKVKNTGNAAAQTELLKPENSVRYWGKHTFPASISPAYGSTGADRFKTFTTTDGTQTLGFLSAIQSRLFVKNGGFRGFDGRSSKDLEHDDETYVDGSKLIYRTPYLTYAETCFMMAEIAQKGGNGLGKSASQWFYAGVKASFDAYQKAAVDAGVPKAADVNLGNFVANLPFLGLPSIYSQAWVNYLRQPEESWAMWKRTGYPQFTDVRPGNNGLIGSSSIAYLESVYDGGQNLVIPRRSALNLSTGSNQNSKNYADAIQAMMTKDPAYGINTLDTKGRIWWDQK